MERPKNGAHVLHGQSFVSVTQLDTDGIASLFAIADKMKAMVKRDGSCDLLKGRILANIFYEPSTRTMCSFAAAMLRLGGQVIPVNESSSSAQKGETLSDTIRCLECYADVLVLRHPIKGSAAEAAAAASKPVINAGDGTGEHPTQALLDLYTMQSELGRLEGLTITCLGDLKNGRTVHSLVQLCARYGMRVHLVSPASLRLPADVLRAAAKGANGWSLYEEHQSLDGPLRQSDVLYVTRVQKERFASADEYDAVKDAFIVSAETMQQAPANMIVLHPLPRVNEIAVEVDDDPRAVYFRQMENGMYVRMALLAALLDGDVFARLG
ncbi:hypothetical protein KFE25_013636 [Diacronema lutheri]|uniref:aspartate carbamoyltransferase n=2 Tax=Diacronema lutheri TaxID=2081491 RepID=A0A8J5XNP2_DIALT|nr:hypothetical protein KFE25_013636 [Diacronema lutheri]